MSNLIRRIGRSEARAGISALASCAAVLATPAAAQDGDPLVIVDPRGTITVSATRLPQKVEEVPATVSVITDRQIADQLASDIKDLVRFEPGVSVRRAPTRFGAANGATGRDGNAGFNIRGLEGNRVLIQVDGVRVPDGFDFGAQSAGRGDYVDVGLVKSVEILRGPASALYGSDGLAGAVSFTTSDPVDFLRNGKQIAGLGRVAYDSADRQFSETAILAARSGDWSALIAYTRRDGHELDNKGTNEERNSRRTAPNPQDSFSNAILGKIVWQPSDAHRVRLTVDHYDDHVRTNVLSGIAPVPTAPTSVTGLNARDETRRDRISLDWRYSGSGALASAQLAFWYQQAQNRQFSAEDRYTAADRTRLNTFDNRVFGASAELRSDLTTGALTHRIVYGGDVSVTRQKGVRDGTVPTPPDVFPTRAFPVTDFTLAGAYLGDEIGVGGGVLTLYPVLRFDHYNLDPKQDALLPGFRSAGQSGSRVSPKIGGVVKLGGGASLFANYAQGFKAPSPTQVNQFFQNLAQGYTSIPNPDLRPETSETWEGGLRVSSGAVSAGVTGFTGRYRNFISQQVVGGSFRPSDPAVFQFINLNRVKIDGVEGRIDLRAPSGVSARMAISYAKGSVSEPDKSRQPLSTIDPLKLVVGIGYDAPERRFGGQIIATHAAQKELGRTVYDDAASEAQTTICNGAPCFRPGGFTILDATAYVRVGEALTLRAGVFNILDAKYAWWSDVRGLAANSTVTDAYTQPGRNVSASLTARF
ncbi:TonB-dependent hemoglobin/transferrin/lactoferrin family receptor [Sphingomonas lycopersici]|uniref:TonB-dependent hemoglobin/transferrin/lactoferrin family receptor n=1 Tax=Sphingomonas lycopersici TaxID=2951807 RepID=A0AA41Z5S9_9SPHN|nr:TonB-dependent hemoglobin/transferrin/lactoferrin family receptor [Sphingomonas lycopersici]MCW6534070.1 TonB-dependent hemoglobin/transferrin/lactoferrin family receptor [Sphingomonas lycopersici]